MDLGTPLRDEKSAFVHTEKNLINDASGGDVSCDRCTSIESFKQANVDCYSEYRVIDWLRDRSQQTSHIVIGVRRLWYRFGDTT